MKGYRQGDVTALIAFVVLGVIVWSDQRNETGDG